MTSGSELMFTDTEGEVNSLVQSGEEAEQGFDLLVVFHLTDQEFGMFASNVREIIRCRATTRVPNSSECIDGVINLRGSIIPVFNMRRKLEMPQISEDRAGLQAVMVVEVDGNEAGILVDKVSDVVKISESEIDHSVGQVEANREAKLIKGAVKLPGRLITLLGVTALLEV